MHMNQGAEIGLISDMPSSSNNERSWAVTG